MNTERTNKLTKGNRSAMAVAYKNGRALGVTFGAGSSGVEAIDTIKRVGEIVVNADGFETLEAYDEWAARIAALWALRHKVNVIINQIDRGLVNSNLPGLTDAEKQEIADNAQKSANKGFGDLVNGIDYSPLDEIPYTESWNPPPAVENDLGDNPFPDRPFSDWLPGLNSDYWEGVENYISEFNKWLKEIEESQENISQEIKKIQEKLNEFQGRIDKINNDIIGLAQTASSIRSPIILDLDGTGINTVGLSAGVNFDHSGDGFAERTGWVGSGDGLLVWDRNANGVIDSGQELFGSETLLSNGMQAVNGFAALAELDSNGDGIIDANDPIFSELRVWVDSNTDGRTDEGELLTLEEAGVQAINVAYADSSYIDANGNEHRQVGSFVTTEGETRTVTDVWFQTDPAYSIPTEWVEVSEEISALPDARGYGTVRDLHQAMAMDESGKLQSLVSAFVAADNPQERETLLTGIIYHWTGVQDIDPYSRASKMIYGNAIGDARRLEALERFMGEKWVGIWCWSELDPNPHGRAAPVLLKAWGDLQALVYGQLMAQSHLKDLFLDIRYGWDGETESVVGDLSEVAASLKEQIESDRDYGLEQLGEFVRSVRGLGLAGSLDMASFKHIMSAMGEDVSDVVEASLEGWIDSNTATEGNDTLRGTEFDDLIDGRGGNDLILGRGGNDTLIGGAGNDTLDGGAGHDELRGGSGSNTYLFGRGHDHDTVIRDNWNRNDVDRIQIKAGVSPSDVQLTRVFTSQWQSDLVLIIKDTGETITVKNHFTASRHAIGEIQFANGTVWDAEDILAQYIFNQELNGTDDDDVLTGFLDQDNYIFGAAGNDTLIGSSGNDTLDGGAGNDELRGGSGSDTYRFGRGNGHDTIIEDSWHVDDIDRIELKAGVAPSDVQLARVRDANNWWNVDDLVLTIVDTGETITVKQHFRAGHRHAVEEIVFADGTVWDAEAIRSQVLIGGDGDDELLGFAGRDNFIYGGAGNDTLIGSDGNDTYRFGLGDGFNVIEESYDPHSIDIIELAEGIAPEDVTVRYTRERDMTVSLSDGTVVLVRNQALSWAESDGYGIEQLRFADGTIWDKSALALRAVVGTDGDDTIVSGHADDIVDGGAGNDVFVNLGGYDTYLFGEGDGHNTIEGGRGKVVFKSGIDQLGVTFARDQGDLVVTIDASGDSIRIGNWFNTWSGSRIDNFEFANGAILSAAEVVALVGVDSSSEILYGSPGDDLIEGSNKNSTIYGREGNDTLIGGEGDNRLYGEAGDDLLIGGPGRDTLYGGDGNDTLNGGAGRDVLYGGSGNNTYLMDPGSGLDRVHASTALLADDTIVFGAGIRPEDITVQLGSRSWGASQEGDVGYTEMVVGFGGNDAVIIRNNNWDDLGRGGVKRFRFENSTEISLAEMVARADGGVMGWQSRSYGDSELLLGSAADDEIYDYSGQSVVVRSGANDDYIYLSGGDNIVSGGYGNDTIYAGFGDDVIAGEAGDDVIDGGDGDDTFLFNYGDGNDLITAGSGTDTLSFGGGITPDMLGAHFDAEGRLVLMVEGGEGGSVTLAGVKLDTLPGDLERMQFIDSDGRVRVFDFSAWVNSNAAVLHAASMSTPFAFVLTDFELTGTVAPAGGLEAVAYAQTGNLFGTDTLSHNTPTDGDDVIFGTPEADVIDAGAGNDIVMGLDGDDTIFGGEGDDLLYGGDGDDWLEGDAGNDTLYGGHGADTLRGGSGRDELYGGWGGDTYLYHVGDEEVVIDDEHRVIDWGYGGDWSYGGEQPMSMVAEVTMLDYGGWDYGGDYGGGYGGAIVDDAPNILQFGEGIRPEDLRYSERDGDLVIECVDRPDDRIVLRGYAPHRETLTRSVDVFRFADGNEIVADSIEIAGVREVGGDEGGWLSGTKFSDTLVGGEGDDYFNSQGGSDLLVGGVGSDTYRIHREAGATVAHVTIVETWRDGDFNQLELTGDVDPDQLQLVFDGRDLLLMLGEDGSSVRFDGFDPRVPGMQPPVDEVSLPWLGVALSFEALVARGIRYGEHTNDIYAINIGDGEISIDDVATVDTPNTVRFGPGITSEGLQERLSFAEDGEGGHWLLVHYGDEGDVLRLAGFNRDDVLGGEHAVEHFLFADGTVVDYATLASWGFTVEGDDSNNTIQGSNLDDRLYGNDGDDVLIGGDGNDELFGGRGNDTLVGGAGDDAYVFAPGDGVDTIIDSGDEDFNFIRFLDGLTPEDITHEWDGSTLLLHYGPSDTVRIESFFSETTGNPAILVMVFEDGTVEPLLERLNRAPTANGELVSASAELGEAFTYAIPEDFFEDPDLNDELRLSARLANGEALPDWLAFDPENGHFTGTPDESDLGSLTLVVTAMDHFGLTVQRSFELLVNDGEADAAGPVAMPDTATVKEDRTLLAWGNVLSNDSHPEGAALSVADAGIRRGEYGWLKLLPNGGYAYMLDNFSSKVQGLGAGEQVEERFSYLASDGDNTTPGELVVTVNGTNDTPELARRLSNVQLARGKAFAWQVPEGSFVDRDRNDVLSYEASLHNGRPLPDWLKFDPETQTFSGTAPSRAIGNLNVRVTASDGNGERSVASDTFRIRFGNRTVVPEGDAGVGAGSSPWQLCNKVDDHLTRFLDSFKTNAKAAEKHPLGGVLGTLRALDAGWFERSMSSSIQPNEQSNSSRNGLLIEQHWQQLQQALNRLDAERQGASQWLSKGQGADLSGLAGLLSSNAASLRPQGDAVGLAAGAQLKGFSGLREGITAMRF